MLRAAVGVSRHTDASEAGRAAAEAASRSLGDHAATFALVFATGAYPQAEVLAAIAGVLPGARLSGCSGEGVIGGSATHEVEFAVAVLAVSSDSVRFEPFLVEGYHADPAGAGRTIATLCGPVDGAAPVCVVILPDGIRGNASALIDGLAAELPRSVPIVGGSAGDAMLFEKTHQYLDERVVSDAVAGFVLRGAATLHVGVSHGCTTVGLDRVVTRAQDGWVFTIDGLPAWEVFKEYLDGDPEDLTAEGIIYLCIGVDIRRMLSSDTPRYVIRTPMVLDKENGALFFPGGGIETGTRVRVTRRDGELIRGSGTECAAALRQAAPGQTPAFVLQFDCAGRGRILFGELAASELIEPLQTILGADIPWIGVHTYGEIAPVDGVPFFHNYSVALCAVYETPPTR
jgi:hypothetical protein